MAVPETIDPTSHLLLDDARLSRLSHEIARNLYPLKVIVGLYGIDEDTFIARVKDHPRFMMYYAEAHAAWNADSNVQTRSAMKSGILFEQWLGEANRLLHDPAIGMAPKVDLAKFLATTAGIAKREGNAQPGDRTMIIINLPGQTVSIDKIVPQQTIEGTSVEVKT